MGWSRAGCAAYVADGLVKSDFITHSGQSLDSESKFEPSVAIMKTDTGEREEGELEKKKKGKEGLRVM